MANCVAMAPSLLLPGKYALPLGVETFSVTLPDDASEVGLPEAA